MKKWIFLYSALAFTIVGCSQESNENDYSQLESEYKELQEKHEELVLEYDQLNAEIEQLRQELEENNIDLDVNEEPDGDNNDNIEEEVQEEIAVGLDDSLTLDQGYYIIGADIPAGHYFAHADGDQTGNLIIKGPDGVSKSQNTLTNEGISIELEQGDTLEIDVSTTITVE
ncbi:hypothetical protein [Bacillus sp. JCM 19034]|uniref:hypothetical protein n=1 Tax=Bacillus sp. JCM 19034 TaxID=1481928 RepID=UPI0007814F95|nr:hypothetical protein [Bacillus sp. JCM 19034]